MVPQNALDTKKHYSHSGWPGGLKTKPLWRLFEHFQQRVGRVQVHLVGRIYDYHPPPTICSRKVKKARQSADVINGDLIAQPLGFFVFRAVHEFQPGFGQC